MPASHLSTVTTPQERNNVPSASLLWHRADDLLVTAFIIMLIVVLQFRAGAFTADLFGDQASHYVSGLLLHDYLTTWAGNPIVFLREFHSHYPLVGIGHWGPTYYVVEAVWMLLFGDSLAAMLLLSAAVTAAIAMICHAIVKSRSNRVIGLLIATAFVVSPIAQKGSTEIMLDAPVALICLLAMLTYARYLDHGRTRDAVLFSLFAGAGMLVKGNAGALALLPGLTILIGRRFDLLFKPSFWLPLPIVALLVLPWYGATYDLVSAGFRYGWGWDYTAVALNANSLFLLSGVGILLLAAGLAGFVIVAVTPRHLMSDANTIGAAALLASVWIFQTVVPAAIQDRYLEPALPPLLILAGWTLGRIVDLLRARSLPFVNALIVVLAATWILPRGIFVERASQLGFTDVVPLAWSNLPPHNRTVLVIAGSGAEGAAVAELAMHDPARPSLFAIRGTRLLGGGGYNAQDYLPLFHTDAEVMAAIDEYHVPLVLFRSDGDSAAWEHIRQVSAAARQFPERWERLYSKDSAGAEVVLYRIRGNGELSADARQLRELSAPRSLAQHEWR